MSKQSEAKDRQGYTTTPNTCSGCCNLQSDMVLPAWMEKRNAEIKAGNASIWDKPYGDEFKVEKNLRCRIGKFAVKKTATCKLFAPKL